MNNETKVLLLYLSSQGREIYLDDILNGVYAMDADEYEANNFWNAYGGLQVVINEYYTVLHVSDFEYLLKVTSFLLNSLYWLAGRQSEWFDKVDSNSVVLRTTARHSIVLKKSREKKVCLSFYPVNSDYVKRRGDKFFDEIIIDEQDWISSVKVALHEYFKLFEECLLPNKDDMYFQYLKVWKNIYKNI